MRSWLKKSVLEKRRLDESAWEPSTLEVSKGRRVGFVFEVFAAVRESTTRGFGDEQWGRVAKSFFGVICLLNYKSEIARITRTSSWQMAAHPRRLHADPDKVWIPISRDMNGTTAVW